MAYDLEGRLVVAVSAGALFELRQPAYILKPGTAFGLVKKLLCVNQIEGWEGRVEVILLSREGTESALQIFRSLSYYHINISRAVFLEGKAAAPYLSAFRTDLFLSAHRDDVQQAVDMGIAAGEVCECRSPFERKEKEDSAECREAFCELRLAFDGDAVLFSDESEQIFKQEGLCAFEENEREKARIPLAEGPFALFLRKLCALREELRAKKGAKACDIRLALVTSRCAPAHERVIRTLCGWGVRMDEIFFLGGIEKRDILQAFDADMFFDDQQIHAGLAAQVVPAAIVPYLSRSKMQEIEADGNETAGKETCGSETLRCEKGGQRHEIRQYSGRNFPEKTKPVYRICGTER